MLYRFLINYLRIRIIQIIFTRLIMRQSAKGAAKNIKLLNFLKVLVIGYFSKKGSKVKK